MRYASSSTAPAGSAHTIAASPRSDTATTGGASERAPSSLDGAAHVFPGSRKENRTAGGCAPSGSTNASTPAPLGCDATAGQLTTGPPARTSAPAVNPAAPARVEGAQ